MQSLSAESSKYLLVSLEYMLHHANLSLSNSQQISSRDLWS